MDPARVTNKGHLSLGATLLHEGQLKDKGFRAERGFACISEVQPQAAGFRTPFLERSRCSVQGQLIQPLQRGWIFIGSSKRCLKIPFPRSSDGGEECHLPSLAFSSLLQENSGLKAAPLCIPLLGLLLPERSPSVMASGFSF